MVDDEKVENLTATQVRTLDAEFCKRGPTPDFSDLVDWVYSFVTRSFGSESPQPK